MVLGFFGSPCIVVMDRSLIKDRGGWRKIRGWLPKQFMVRRGAFKVFSA
jgi:hypothetical protein